MLVELFRKCVVGGFRGFVGAIRLYLVCVEQIIGAGLIYVKEKGKATVVGDG